MDGAQCFINNGFAQSDLDMNGFRLVNADLSNFPPSGIPPTVVPPASNWLRTWDSPSQTWGYSQPGFGDLSGYLTSDQMLRITALGTIRIGTWQADVIDALYLPTLDGIRPPGAEVSMNDYRITDLADPIADGDAVNRRFMDFLLQGLNVKEAVRVASTTRLTPATLLRPVDGVTLQEGDRVLVKDQGEGLASADNGIYVASTGVWQRSEDADVFDELDRAYCTVLEGDVNGGSSWVQVLPQSDPIGTSEKTFVLFSNAGSIIAGNGLDFDGNTLNVVGTSNRIDVGSAVDISPAYVGQATITTLGVITTGEWQGEILDPLFGGTGEANDSANTLLLDCPVRVDVVSPAPNPSLQFIIQHVSSVTVPPLGILATQDGEETFINKRIERRTVSITTSAQPNIDTDAKDVALITALATNITSMTANLTGTPTENQDLEIWFHDDGTQRTINWGANFTEPAELTLPANTDVGFWTYTRFAFSIALNKWVLTSVLTMI